MPTFTVEIDATFFLQIVLTRNQFKQTDRQMDDLMDPMIHYYVHGDIEMEWIL